VILKNARRLMELMDFQPYDFVRNSKPADLKSFCSFTHRTFNGADCTFYLQALGHLYRDFDSMEAAFMQQTGKSPDNLKVQKPRMNVKNPTLDVKIHTFRKRFFQRNPGHRSTKHFSDPTRGSAAKRFNMFLRWMVRTDSEGVDFGIWKGISPAELIIPLDVHTARVSRSLSLLLRKSTDWTAACELTDQLRKFDPKDPVKYDYALFGLGVFEKFGCQ
jgi:uncharacterized protein (TIGR02757 family)